MYSFFFVCLINPFPMAIPVCTKIGKSIKFLFRVYLYLILFDIEYIQLSNLFFLGKFSLSPIYSFTYNIFNQIAVKIWSNYGEHCSHTYWEGLSFFNKLILVPDMIPFSPPFSLLNTENKMLFLLSFAPVVVFSLRFQVQLNVPFSLEN